MPDYFSKEGRLEVQAVAPPPDYWWAVVLGSIGLGGVAAWLIARSKRS
jgi:hypothetical protein